MDARLLFTRSASSPEGTRYDIYEITAEGKKLEQLTEEGSNRFPAYSPDGTKIAYVSHRNGDSHIYLMDTNGRNAVKLTRTPPGTDNIITFLAAWCIGSQPKRKVADILGSSQTVRQPVMMSMNSVPTPKHKL